jgi:hypothetical protein
MYWCIRDLWGPANLLASLVTELDDTLPYLLGIRGRRRATLTLTIGKVKVQLSDWFGQRLVTIGRDLYIYRWLDIALSLNQRILTKYSENLYSDLSLIHENLTLRFSKLETPVLQPVVFLKCHNFLIRAPNHVFHISILIVSMRASWWNLQIFSWSSTSCSLKHVFVS